MKPNRIMCIIPAGIVAGIFMFSSCHSGYTLASVEGSRIEVTAALDANPDSAAIAVLAPYQKTVDSIMSPVIGQSADRRCGISFQRLTIRQGTFMASLYIDHQPTPCI